MFMPINRRILSWTVAIVLSVAALIAQIHEADAAEPKRSAGCSGRIVSIGGAVTEILYALGMEDCIVAIDSTSQFPAKALREKKNVGYMRALSAEGVLSAGGTLLLATSDAGPAEAVRALKASSIRFVTVPNEPTSEGVLEKIRIISKEVGKLKAGEQLASSITTDFSSLKERREHLSGRTKALFVLATQGSRILVGGRGTSADSILTLAGASNVAADINGFKPITIEALTAMAPDAIVVMQRQSGTHSAEALLELAAVKQTPAGRSNRIFEMSGSYLLGFGPRTPAAANELMGKLYPQSLRTR
jgi:heme transport system substrate-binding protein